MMIKLSELSYDRGLKHPIVICWVICSLEGGWSYHGDDVVKSELHIDLNRLVHIRRGRDVVVQVWVVVHKKLKIIRPLTVKQTH